MIKSSEGMLEHAGYTIGSNQGGKVRFLGDFGIILVGLDQGLDIGEAARLGKAFNGEVLGVARGEWGGVVFGNGGVDF